MKQLKAMIFDLLAEKQLGELKTSCNIFTEEFKRLIFGLFKENAHTRQINPAVWLYLNNDSSSFRLILEDIFQECYKNYLENKETAYKNTMKYVYNQYYKRQVRNRPIEHHEQELATTLDNNTVNERFTSYSLKLDTKEKQEYYKSLVIRTYNNLHQKQKRVFTSTRQKEQTINKLQKLQII